MRITESQLRRIISEEILKESVTDSRLIDVVSGCNPMTDVEQRDVGEGYRIRCFVPNARKIIISQLHTAPRKWVLLQSSTEGREWRDAYYNPYIPVKTGTFDPTTYRMSTDPEIDMAAVKFVGQER